MDDNSINRELKQKLNFSCCEEENIFKGGEKEDSCPASYVSQLNSIIIITMKANIYLEFTTYQTLCKILYIHSHIIFTIALGATHIMSILHERIWVSEGLILCPRWTGNKCQNPGLSDSKTYAFSHSTYYLLHGMTDITVRSYSNPTLCSKQLKLYN